MQGLVEVGRAAYRASQTRNQEAVGEVINQIPAACANCRQIRPTALDISAWMVWRASRPEAGSARIDSIVPSLNTFS